MQIWVDADACPKPIKEILYRAAVRKRVTLTLVANQYLPVPKSPFIKTLRVDAGFDVADNRIADEVHGGDIVITADIPLAAAVVKRGAAAINPRGYFYTEDNIRERLSMRNFLEELRGSGVQTGGPEVFDQADRQAFANQLDRLLARLP